METPTTDVTTRADAPFLLTPGAVADMLNERAELQVMKFRTTCSDCVPNL